MEAILHGGHAVYALASRWGPKWCAKGREANLDAYLKRVGIFLVVLLGLHRAVADGMFTGARNDLSKRSLHLHFGNVRASFRRWQRFFIFGEELDSLRGGYVNQKLGPEAY